MSKKIIDVYSPNNNSIVINGKTYITGKFALQDFLNFQDFRRKKEKKLRFEEYEMMNKEIDVKKVRKEVAELTEDYYLNLLQTVEGSLFIFMSTIERLNKGVDIEDIRNNLSIEDIARINDSISEEVDEIKEEEEEKTGNFPPKKKKVAKKKT